MVVAQTSRASRAAMHSTCKQRCHSVCEGVEWRERRRWQDGRMVVGQLQLWSPHRPPMPPSYIQSRRCLRPRTSRQAETDTHNIRSTSAAAWSTSTTAAFTCLQVGHCAAAFHHFQASAPDCVFVFVFRCCVAWACARNRVEDGNQRCWSISRAPCSAVRHSLAAVKCGCLQSQSTRRGELGQAGRSAAWRLKSMLWTKGWPAQEMYAGWERLVHVTGPCTHSPSLCSARLGGTLLDCPRRSSHASHVLGEKVKQSRS